MTVYTSTGLSVNLVLDEDLTISARFLHPSLGPKPVRVSSCRWGKMDGKEGVVGGFFRNGEKKVCLTIPREAWDQISHAKSHQEGIYKRRVSEAKIISLEYHLGCDVSDIIRLKYSPSLEDIPFDLQYERIQADEETFSCLPLWELGKELGAEALPSNLSSYGGWRFEGAAFETLAERLSQKKARKEAEKEARREAEGKKITEALAKAKATGKPVSLHTWVTSECTENLPDCSFDQANEMVYPDGHRAVVYHHCH